MALQLCRLILNSGASFFLLSGTCPLLVAALPSESGSDDQQRLNQPVLTYVEQNNSIDLPEVVVRGKKSDLYFNSLNSNLSDNQTQKLKNQSLSELEKIVPNYSYVDTGNRTFNTIAGMRGLVNSLFFSQSPVAVYIDEIPLGRNSSLASSFYQLQQVEVLRGIQSPVFGLNGEAGALLLTTKRPGNSLRAGARASYGSYELHQYSGYLSGPLIKDQLYLGISGFYESRDGYLLSRNLNTRPDDREGKGGKLDLVWEPSEEWQFSLVINPEFYNDGARRFSARQLQDPFVINNTVDGTNESRNLLTGLKIKYFGQNVNATFVSSFTEWDLDPHIQEFRFPPTVPLIQRYDFNQKLWSQELKFQSSTTDSSEVLWKTGLFFSHEDHQYDGSRQINPFPGIIVFDSGDETVTRNTFAWYGTLSYPLSDTLRLIGGGRFDYRREKAVIDVLTTRNVEIEENGTWDGFNISPKIGIEYDLQPNLTLFANTGYSFRPGGQIPFQGASSLDTYDTEKILTTEVGFSSTWCEDRVQLQGNFFYSHVMDYQVERFVNALDYRVVNIPEVDLYGGEVELIARVTEELELSLSTGITQSEINNYVDPITQINSDGNRVAYTPLYEIILSADYQHSSGFFAGVSGQLVGETFNDEINSSFRRQADYALLHGQIGYQRDHFKVAVFGKNITDTKYFQYFSIPFDAGTVGAPQLFGFEVELIY